MNIFAYLYFAAIGICIFSLLYLVITDIIDRVREHKEMRKGFIND